MAANKKITVLASALAQNTHMDDLCKQITKKVGKLCKVKNEIKDSHGKVIICDIELHKDCTNDHRKQADDICKAHIACGEHRHSPCGGSTGDVDGGTFEDLATNQAVSTFSIGVDPATLDVTVTTSGCDSVGSESGAGKSGGRALSLKDNDTTTTETYSGSGQYASSNSATFFTAPAATMNSVEISFDFKVDHASGTVGNVAHNLNMILGELGLGQANTAFVNIDTKNGGGTVSLLMFAGTAQEDYALPTAYLPNAYNSVKLRSVQGGALELTFNGVAVTASAPDGGATDYADISAYLQKSDVWSTSGAKTNPRVLVDNYKIVIA